MGWNYLFLVKPMLWFFAGAFISIFAHECGHFVSGSALGLDFHSLRFGPVVIDRSHKWPIRIDATISGLVTGYVFFVPDVKIQRWKWGFAALGGPATNIIIGCCAIVGLGGRADGMYSAHPFLSAVVTCSALLIVGNLLWIDDPWMPNDLFNFVCATRASLWRRWIAILTSDYLSFLGIRPSEWPDSIEDQLMSYRDGSRTELRATLLTIINRIDRKQFSDVIFLITRAEALATQFQRSDVLADLAFWVAAIPGLLGKAKELRLLAADLDPRALARKAMRRTSALIAALDSQPEAATIIRHAITELQSDRHGRFGIPIAQTEVMQCAWADNESAHVALPIVERTVVS